MKKKMLITIPIIVAIIATLVIVLIKNKKEYVTIQRPRWNQPGEYFVLDTIENVSSHFKKPANMKQFMEKALSRSEYVGQYILVRTSTFLNDCYYFFSEDAMFALIADDMGVELRNCDRRYQSTNDDKFYIFPTPADVTPLGAWEDQKYEDKTYAELFISYEECVEHFYQYFSSNIVSCDDEKKTITITPFCFDDNKLSDTHRIVIDFINETTTEIILDAKTK